MPLILSPVEEEYRRARHEVVAAARGILDGAVGVVAGTRLLLRLQRAIKAEDDSDFVFFIGVNSLTDHLPVGNVRRHWRPDALQEKDKELRAFELQVKHRAHEVCRKLIEKYDHSA